MAKSIKKNYLYNLIYQIFLLIVPIIVSPYIARVLLADGVGEYSFSLSIANYFVILASFGFAYYAQREIAKKSDDKKQQSIIFFEIYIIKMLFSLLSCALFAVLIFTKVLEYYNSILIILMINIIAVGFDAAYLLQGNEEFKKIVGVNFIVKILGVASIFIFVKDQNDIWKYTLINSLVIIISNLLIYIYIPQFLTKIKIKELNCKRHILPAFKLFVPTIAISIYALLDKTLIGLITKNNSEVGYYEQAEKICKIGLTIVTSLSAVMIPNNAKCFSEKNDAKVNSNVNLAIKFSALIGIPLAIGLVIISGNLVPWFLGPGYENCIPLIKVLGFLVIAIGLNNVFGIQYLIPTDKEKIFTFSVITGAITNLILNILLIPKYKAMGASIASLVAEVTILAFQMIYLRKTFKFIDIIKGTYKYLISGIIMFIVAYPFAITLNPTIINSIIIIAVSALIYGVLLIILREKLIIETMQKIKMKLRR